MYFIVLAAAVAVLISFLLCPIYRIYGNSMSPTLEDGNYIVAVKSRHFDPGDVVVISYNNKLLVKRVIALPGQWVDIDQNGVVFVDDEMQEEPYIREKALGDCNIRLPYQVPEGTVFVMGDNRAGSLDSRNTSVGCIPNEQIIGWEAFRIWPLVD